MRARVDFAGHKTPVLICFTGQGRLAHPGIAAMPDRVRSYFSHEYVRYAQ